MGRDTAFLYGSFAARYSFQKSHSILKGFEGDDVHQVGGRDSVLGDEDRRPIFHQLSENLGGFPLQGCDEMGFHKSDTKVSLCFPQAQTVSASDVSPPERLPQKLLVERLRSREASAARPRTISCGLGASQFLGENRTPTVCASRERQARTGSVPPKNGGQGPPVQESSTKKWDNGDAWDAWDKIF